MLCCVPKRPADGGPFHDEALFQAPGRSPSIREIQIELYPEEDAPPPFLLPCAICARTFTPQSLEKHTRICERAASKKRRPFDSAKQRIQGTELAEFLPKQETRRHDERTTRSSWKKTHDDFLRTIREARGDVMDTHKQYNSLISSGAPTRANEKGTCPTCNRQFGIKAYDRHVAWCKDRITRMPMSPATNLAKERLEARMRYRAPALKNRRAINREKYSPGSMTNQGAKVSLSSPAIVKPKETVSVINSNRESPVKQKSAAVRRPGQLKDSPISSGPTKSRLADRTNRATEDHDFLLTSTSCRSSHLALSSHRPLRFPVPPATRPRINHPITSNEITSLAVSSRRQSGETRVQNDEVRNREVCSARTQRNIVSARSQGHPKINDVAVNDKTLGVTVQPCRIRKDDQLVTWKQISRKKDDPQANNFSREFQLLDIDRRCDRVAEIDTVEKRNRVEGDLLITNNDFTGVDDELKDIKIDKMENDNGAWLGGIQNLNQTYLIRDSEGIESSEIFHGSWRVTKHSPRVEFYFKDREDEICEYNRRKSRGERIANNEEIRIADQVEKLKMDIVDKKNDKIKVGQKTQGLKMDSEDREDNWKASDKEIEVTGCKIEKLNINTDIKNNNCRSIDEKVKISGYNIKEAEENIEDTRDIKMNDVDIKLNKLNMNEGDKKNQQIDETIFEITKYTEIKEIKQNLCNSDRHIKPSTFDVAHSIAQNRRMKECEESCFKELKIVSTDNSLTIDQKSSDSKDEDLTLHFHDRNSSAFSDSFVGRSQDYLKFKDELPECKRNACSNNSLEVKESMITFISDRSARSNSYVNNCNNPPDCNLSPKDKMLPSKDNICCASLDLTDNIKEMSSSVSCRVVSPEKNFVKNTEVTEIDEGRHGNDLITLCDKKPEKNLKGSKSTISLPRNLKIVADNYLDAFTNDVSLQVAANRQEKLFNSINFETIVDNVKDERTDFNADLDSCYDKSRLGRYSIKTEVMANEGSRERNMNSEFDHDSDNAACVGERDTRCANDLESSVTLKNNVKDSRCYQFLDASVNLPRRVSSSAKRTVRERPVNSVEMKRKIRESMNLLRGSTDSLISSIEFVELASIRRPKANCAYERETIEIIRPCRRFRRLPDIKNDSAETREDSERSYWEKASRISRSRLIDLEPSRHAGYKLAKKDPRILILPPVPDPSLIDRSGASKDYDPFLLAEQQMNDLLSDTSDQSMTGKSKPEQTRDTLYPLSHSSAFVKYPPSDKRSSLIAPPFEFDDLASDFSSDSTETNSIAHEIFLPDLANKDTTDLAGPRPVRELGRRVIIDKSKALGVDERRGVVGSADKPRKIFDRITPKITRPLIDRSNSIRASSAPRISSGPDRKISDDVRKVQGSKIAESQRSSDLNQRNNNYSSLSGSNLSLNSIVSSSELDVKRSSSMFDELLTSFEEEAFPDLRSLLDNESFDLFSPGGDRQRNGSLISDEELSSPDSYKPQDQSKLSNDSAYSSLNRKYSHHGRSTNDVVGRLDEDPPRNGTSHTQTAAKCKMSKFCHECGQRFPETAKFCCECGVRRLAL